MKVQLALLTLLALSAVGLFMQNGSKLESGMDMETYQQFLKWQVANGKNYSEQNDEMYRFTVFSENLQFIQEHNNQDNEVTLGLTRFADLTNDEFRAIATSEIVPTEKKNLKFRSPVNADWSDINWVSKGAVTSVKDQGQCGSCWAFATVAGLEGLRAVQDGTLESLSNQQVTSCTNWGAPQPWIVGGCNGGNTQVGWKYTANNGITTEAAYPYENGNYATAKGKTIPCSSKVDSFPKVFQNKSSVDVAQSDNQAVYTALQNQPLAIAIDAGSIYFQLYSGGVLSNKNCGTNLNHAVTLVGYESNTNSWIVKNSWGASWGNKGYVNILNVEGDGICGINMEANYPTL